MITKTKSYFIFREFMYQLHILDLKRIVGYVILEKNKTKWKGEVKQSKAKQSKGFSIDVSVFV